MQPKVYDAFDTPPKVATDFSDDPGKTDQSAKDECDLNIIMARVKQTGVMPPLEVAGRFADVSNIGDYKEAMDIVRQAEDSFMQLDANIREAFDNDPGRLLDALHDPSQHKKLIDLGLVNAPAIALPPDGVILKPESGTGPTASHKDDAVGSRAASTGSKKAKDNE